MSVFNCRSLAAYGAGVLTVIAASWGVPTWSASALPGSGESTYVPVTPVRILDTRDPVNLGLAGPFVSPTPLDLQVTGAIPTAGGTATVVPAGATGVSLNVTVVNPSADGFLSVRPADAAGAPTTSSLNFVAGSTVPNAVEVQLPLGADAGKIEITYDAYGSAGPVADVLIDVLGYTTSQGIQSLVAALAAKANATDVYTRAQADARFVPSGEEIVMTHGLDLVPNSGDPATISRFVDGTRVEGGSAHLFLDGPAFVGGTQYGLRSIEYCVDMAAPAFVTSVQIHGERPTADVEDTTDRVAAGCYTVTFNAPSRSVNVMWEIAGGGGSLLFQTITSTWAPLADLGPSS